MLFVDPNHLEIPHRGTFITKPPSHALALEDTRGRSIHPSATLVTVHLFDAVRGPLTLEAMSLHDTSSTAPLGRPRHIDTGYTLEDLDGEILTDVNMALFGGCGGR